MADFPDVLHSSLLIICFGQERKDVEYETFAAIDIGSYEVEMKIFQITSGKGIKEIDCVCHRMELGKDVYRDGRIGVEMTDELCRVLK